MNASRYTLLVQRAQSLVRKSSSLCTSMNASHFNKLIFAPAYQSFVYHHCVGFFSDAVLPAANTPRGRRLHQELDGLLHPFDAEDVGLMRAIWEKIDAKPKEIQLQFVHLFRQQISKLAVGPHITVLKMLFRFAFFHTLEFQQSVE